MTLDTMEFLRRFLQHVLPKGFMKIRHYGLLANRQRQQKLQRSRQPSRPGANPSGEVGLGDVAHGCFAGSESPTWRCWQHPG